MLKNNTPLRGKKSAPGSALRRMRATDIRWYLADGLMPKVDVATMARAIEGLNKALFAGDTTRIRVWDCKFTKPLVLPNQVGLYVHGNDVFVGDAPGGSAYLVGSFTTATE